MDISCGWSRLLESTFPLRSFRCHRHSSDMLIWLPVQGCARWHPPSPQVRGPSRGLTARGPTARARRCGEAQGGKSYRCIEKPRDLPPKVTRTHTRTKRPCQRGKPCTRKRGTQGARQRLHCVCGRWMVTWCARLNDRLAMRTECVAQLKTNDILSCNSGGNFEVI